MIVVLRTYPHMAKFRVYNVQLLPTTSSEKEVGRQGYRRLFSAFQKYNKAKLKDGKEGSYHFRQAADTFIGPVDNFSFPAGMVCGEFSRYRKVEKVTQLGTRKQLFKGGAKTGVSSEEPIAFVFDTDSHQLAIEAPQWMPSSDQFAAALSKMLEPIASEEFPTHELTVNGVSQKSELEKVFASASSFSKVDLDLTFRNGHDAEQLLEEMRESRTKSLSVVASAGKGGRMSYIPSFVKDMLLAVASGLGNARISYFVPHVVGSKNTERSMVYDTKDMPVTFQVNRTAAALQDDLEFYTRIKDKLDSVTSDSADDVETGSE